MLSDDSGGRGWPSVLTRMTRTSATLSWCGRAWSLRRFAPNDEAISGHRLWRAGLNDVLWLGLVEDSELIASLKKQSSVHPHHESRRYDFLDHYIAPLKECVVEVVVRSLVVHRLDGNRLEAAAAATAH